MPPQPFSSYQSTIARAAPVSTEPSRQKGVTIVGNAYVFMVLSCLSVK